jgi:hypothetical protein
MNSEELLKIIENYCRKTNLKDDAIKVTRVADHTTMFVEQSADGGRMVTLSKYIVDGITYWAGYSSRNQMVYLSLAA